MHIPKAFEFDELAGKIAFMKQYSFATIITSVKNVPVASHLPFVIEDSSEKLLLTSHFAVANEQAEYIGENTSLVIFSEPHAYISPSHYDRQESVPTWDYISVHAYGKAFVLKDDASKIGALEKTIAFYDKDYAAQWNSLSDSYKTGMLRGIVVFELEVSKLEGQKKLSQNKSEEERERIIRQLKKSGNSVENALAVHIQNTL